MRVRLRTDRLQQLLAASPLSQNHWAIKLGISRGHWSALVNGRHPYPSGRTRLRMLEVFGVRLEELFEVEPGSPAPQETDVRAALSARYLIDRELGQGAMGTVYLGRDVSLGRTVAIKVMSPEAVCGIGTSAFLREVATVARLQHPHILPLFDSGVAAEHPWFVMPWVRDGSLKDWLRRRTRCDLPTALRLARGLAAALDHAHAEHVLHCDVKPANILLQDEHAWLMDFGISRALHAEVSEWRARQSIDVSAGTPAYVSPEQANGEADLDGRADVYSLGCVVYEMLAGRPPFEGATTEAVVARRFLGPPPSLRSLAPDTPRAAAAVIAGAMEVERGRRPASAGEFVEHLTAAAEGRSRLLGNLTVGATRALGAARRATGRPAATGLGGPMDWLQDLRLTVRALRRAPRFALAFILPLALGLGAGATFFSVIDQVLYRPPAMVRDPGGLVQFAVARPERPDPFAAGSVGASWADYQAIARHMTSLEATAAWSTWRPSLGRGQGARRIAAVWATASWFPLLGVQPQLGRFFLPDEDRANSDVVPCVAGDRLWRNEFGGTADVLGRSVRVGRLTCHIVGVAPPGFNGLGFTAVDLFVPLRAGAWEAQGSHPELWTTDGSYWLRIVGRPKPGVSLEALRGELQAAYRQFAVRRRDPQLLGTFVAQPLMQAAASSMGSRLRIARWLTGGAIVLLLLVAANLVNLIIARDLGRARETAIRLALGGGRLRLFRMHLLESLGLAVLAAAASLLLLRALAPVMRTVLFPGVDFAGGLLTPKLAVLCLAAGVSLALAMAALASLSAGRRGPLELLNGAARLGGSPRQRAARLGLVTVQAALSMLLLVSAIAFTRSFRNAARFDLGYEIRNLVFAEPRIDVIDTTFTGRQAFYQRLRDHVAALPGVASASLGYMNPWYYNRTESVSIPGRDSLPLIPGQEMPFFDAVTPDYLETTRLRLRAGRWFNAADASGSAPVIVVSESLARFYWPGEREVIGRCLVIGEGSRTCRQIVGIVADTRVTGGLDYQVTPTYYLPVAQAAEYEAPSKLFIRTSGDVQDLLPMLRREIQGFVPDLPASTIQPVQEQFDPLLAPWRLGAMAFTGLGALAAIIAMLGLFSVLAYLVAERRREFAIRGALGAQAGQILAPVIRQGVLVVLAGGLAGAALVVPAARWLQPQLFQVMLADPRVIGAVLAGLLLIGVAASVGPARVAARQDPMQVLRTE